MSDILRDKLGVSAAEKSDAGRTISKIKGLTTFFADAIDSLKETTLVEAIKEATPWWGGAVVGALAEATPVVKFAVGLFEKLTEEHDPYILGLLASTLAYQRSVENAISWAGSPDVAKKVDANLKSNIAALELDKDVDFKTFSFADALNHSFVKGADAIFQTYLKGVGYSETQQRLLITRVHRRFVGNLKAILSNGKLKKKFEPFIQLMQLQTEEERAYDAILSHVEFQRWQFQEAPVFGKEPFALGNVYIDTECGILRWQDIREGARRSETDAAAKEERFDPFREQFGGRHDLLTKVLELIGDKNFHDAIVVQGAAGSGKSSFTLKLCTALEREGLYPVRIRLRDLPLDRHIADAIPRALFPPDHELPLSLQGRNLEDPFTTGVFNQTVSYGSATIRPYVLILDGWDEISLSTDEGFKVKVGKMLDQVRTQFLRAPGADVRVVLTGRPSAEVGESNFLKDNTPVLTVRPIKPDDLKTFVERLRSALEQSPQDLPPESESWAIPPDDELDAVFARYEEDFALQRGEKNQTETEKRESGSMAVLGLPLLAHLAIRLIAQWKGDRAALIADPTTLYRNLVDLTCIKRGQPAESSIEMSSTAYPTGLKLRHLLHRVAVATTAFGEESIGYKELALRLKLAGNALGDQAQQLTKEHDLATLMIAFFFKGGHEALGCEFLHKSFREYLFAEAIVEALKTLGLKDASGLTPRRGYWKDYDQADPQFGFSRILSELLSPQWLSLEVVTHIEHLLPWEIERATRIKSSDTEDKTRSALPALPIEHWEGIRDRVADMWKWWGEGVHMRPQPLWDEDTGQVTLQRSYAEKLVDLDAPRDRSAGRRKLQPSRTTTMDAHLGDGLFRLSAILHYQIALHTGWLRPRSSDGIPPRPNELWQGVGPAGIGAQPYQSIIQQEQGRWVLFAPSGEDKRYFAHYIARVNAAGWRPMGIFPFGTNMSGIDLRHAQIGVHGFEGRSFRPSRWSHANLCNSDATSGWFRDADFTEVLAENAKFDLTYLASARFTRAHLGNTTFQYAFAWCTDFREADLTGAIMYGATCEEARFTGAILDHVNFEDTRLDKAIDVGNA
ncbi:MAG: hypothetical protein QOI07_2520 [Verrucomicrobiota bacterium]|jgi:hypothetical protein